MNQRNEMRDDMELRSYSPILPFVLAKYYSGLVKLRRGVSLIWLEF